MLPGRSYGAEDILRIAWQRKWVIVLPMIAIGVAAVMYARELPDMFRSETTILIVPQRVPESYVRATVTSRIEDRLGSLRQQILSRGKLEPVIVEFKLYAKERATMPMEAVVERMRQAVNVDIVRDDAFSIGYVSTDPVATKKVAERLANLFIEENLNEREVLAEGTNSFLETQLDAARRRLEEHEGKLAEYRQRYTGALPSQLDSNLQILSGLNVQAQSVANEIERNRDARAALDRTLTDVSAVTSPMASSRLDGPAPGSTLDRLEAARAEYEELRARVTPEHPDLSAAQRLVTELERKAAAEAAAATGRAGQPAAPQAGAAAARRAEELRIQRENLDREISRKQEQEAQIRNDVAMYKARVESTPARESELIALTRDYQTLQEIYTSLLAKKEDAAIAANLERRQIGEQFKVLDPARVPQQAFSPNRLQINLIGVLGGLVFGLAVAGFLEYRDATLKTEDDVRVCLSLPVLVAIPMLAEAEPVSRRKALTLEAARMARGLIGGGARES